MLAAEIIVLNLVVLSLGGWTLLFRSSTAQPLRDAGLWALTDPPRQQMSERLFFGTLIAVAVWLMVPAVLVSNKTQLANVLGMTKHPLWSVTLSCISGTISLLIMGPVAWFVFRQRDQESGPESVNSFHSSSQPLNTRSLPKNDNPYQTPQSDPISDAGKVENQASGGHQPGDENALQNKTWRQKTTAGIRGFLLSVVPVALVLVATQALRSKQTQHSLLKLLTESPNAQTVGSVFLAAVVLAPLAEELVFRVFLQSWLESFLRPAVAIVIVALGFSAVHGWPDMLPLIPLALVLGGLFYLTRSYLAVVVTHALFNLTNVVLAVLTMAK